MNYKNKLKFILSNCIFIICIFISKLEIYFTKIDSLVSYSLSSDPSFISVTTQNKIINSTDNRHFINNKLIFLKKYKSWVYLTIRSDNKYSLVVYSQDFKSLITNFESQNNYINDFNIDYSIPDILDYCYLGNNEFIIYNYERAYLPDNINYFINLKLTFLNYDGLNFVITSKYSNLDNINLSKYIYKGDELNGSCLIVNSSFDSLSSKLLLSVIVKYK